VAKNLEQPMVGLGTVQFGLPYGVNYEIPLIEKSNVHSIISQAIQLGIKFFDTAVNYGESEQRIGEFFSQNPLSQKKICISTKIPKVEQSIWKSATYFNYIKETAKKSLSNLNMTKHNLLQFHQCDLKFLTSKAVHSVFKRLLEEKICESIGISVYTPEQAFAALEIPTIKALQIPVNILDRRFITNQLHSLYVEKKISVIARSIFLQGLLIPKIQIPNVKRNIELQKLKEKCLNHIGELNLQKISLDFLFNNLHTKYLDIALIGVNSTEELLTNFEYIKSPSQLENNMNEILREIGDEAAIDDLLDPSLWNN
jgi:aryl-alcohol dehydrogenase-like predicted oxidoreductase